MISTLTTVWGYSEYGRSYYRFSIEAFTFVTFRFLLHLVYEFVCDVDARVFASMILYHPKISISRIIHSFCRSRLPWFYEWSSDCWYLFVPICIHDKCSIPAWYNIVNIIYVIIWKVTSFLRKSSEETRPWSSSPLFFFWGGGLLQSLDLSSLSDGRSITYSGERLHTYVCFWYTVFSPYLFV